MPLALWWVLTAVFVLLSLVGAVLSFLQWRSRGEWQWVAVSMTVAFGCLAALMCLQRFDNHAHLSVGSWLAFAAAMPSGWMTAAARLG